MRLHFVMGCAAERSIERSAAQPVRVDPLRRADRILIEIDPPGVADRIARNEAADLRVIVPMPVVMQTGLMIVVLPHKADRVSQPLLMS